MTSTSYDGFNVEDLRNRGKSQRVDPTVASDLVSKLNEEEKVKGKARKTFGRTGDGTIFMVPETYDMVSQLLLPSQPKNIGDLVILIILTFHIAIFYFVPATWRSWILGLTFLLWRASYDVGIGYLLDIQSKRKRLVAWAQNSGLFLDPKTGKNLYSGWYKLIKYELETKISKDFKIENAPVEYNTWLLFRRVVDLVLMSDFVSYTLLAISLGFGERPFQESIWITILRWVGGACMILFNVWVKLDAHRVVKDFAWYWGDFFYLVDEMPVFDGVFQMAPHPMYSIGYIGYYGIATIARSYPLLFISIAAHLMQFAFLFAVEIPHMDKTYPEVPEYREQHLPGIARSFPTTSTVNDLSSVSLYQRPSILPTDTSRGVDPYRVTDILGLLIPVYCALAAALTPSDHQTRVLFVLHAIIWRVWYAGGSGFVLHCQSARKLWTKHFMKHGEDQQEAWKRWKELYYISQRMATSTFVAAAWKAYSIPSDFSSDYNLLKHIIAVALVLLQLTISTSASHTLGDFGMFYGDFFWPVRNAKLNYSKGPYRYLNNPEQVAGMAGLWGAVLLTGDGMIFALALMTHTMAFIFHYAVERPHQRRLYKEDIRKDSGVLKVIRPILPTFLQNLDIDATVDGVVDRLETFLEDIVPVILVEFDRLTKSWVAFSHRLPLKRLDPNIRNIDSNCYSVEILYQDSSKNLFVANYGHPIKIRWTAPHDHSPKDWIGLYSVAHNTHREITQVSSQGRWVATNPGQYDSENADIGCLETNIKFDKANDMVYGEMLFSADKLWWETGTYEFRYHHNGKHNVLAISQPFEMHINRFDDDGLLHLDKHGIYLAAVEQTLLPVIQSCFDDLQAAPVSVTDMFGSLIKKDSKYSKRGVYAIKGLFGIELDPEVVRMDGNVRNLAWRVCMAKRALAPFSMSSSDGRTTPD